jgi:hypothetical protein
MKNFCRLVVNILFLSCFFSHSAIAQTYEIELSLHQKPDRVFTQTCDENDPHCALNFQLAIGDKDIPVVAFINFEQGAPIFYFRMGDQNLVSAYGQKRFYMHMDGDVLKDHSFQVFMNADVRESLLNRMVLQTSKEPLAMLDVSITRTPKKQ